MTLDKLILKACVAKARSALRDERLSGEIFDAAPEAKVLIERCGQRYDAVGPYGSLCRRLPAPRTILSGPAVPAYARLRPAQQGPNQRTILS